LSSASSFPPRSAAKRQLSQFLVIFLWQPYRCQDKSWEKEKMAKWQNGEMAKWRNGEVAKWRNGEMAKWFVIPLSLFNSFTLC